MSAKERVRIGILADVSCGSLSLTTAAAELGVSCRQMRRIRRRHAGAGDAGLAHRLRGKASNRKADDAVRERVLALCRGRYAGFGPTLVAEYLPKLDDEPVSPGADTIRRWLSEERLMPRRRRRGKHRSRRERRRRPGELVRMDGSWHDWFEGRRAWCCLMVMIDDATGRVRARFYERETLGAAFDLFGRYALAHGLPGALYVDRAAIYRSDAEPTPEQALAGERPATQFGRAMRGLSVGLILANGPVEGLPSTAGQGVGGAGEPDAVGPAGQGDAPGGRRRRRRRQPAAGRFVPGVVQRAVRGARGGGGRRASRGWPVN